MLIQSTVIVFGIIIGAICIIDASLWNKKGQLTLKRFFLLDGQLRLGGFAITISAANLSLGNFIIFISTWGYNYGLSGLIVFLVNLSFNVLGFILYLRVFAPYIENNSNSGTIHEYIAEAYANAETETTARLIRLFASTVTVTGLIFAILFELSLATDLLRPESAVQKINVFCVLASIVALLTAFGGFRTLIASDLLNSAFLLVGMFALVFLMSTHSPNTPALLGNLSWSGVKQLGWASILSICVVGSGWMLVAMDQWQRSCAARSYRTSFRGTIIYLIVLATFATLFALWGAFDAKIMPEITKGVDLAGATNPLVDIQRIPISSIFDQIVITTVTVGLIFAGVSTTNTFLNVGSHSLTTDVLVGLIARRDLSSLDTSANTFFVSIARVLIILLVIVIVVSYIAATSLGILSDPLNFFFIAYSVQFALLAPMGFTAVPKSRRPGAKAAAVSIVCGFLTSIFIGMGSWYLVQIKSGPILNVPPEDWLVLTPVLTVTVGLVSLIVAGALGHGRQRIALRT